MLPAEGVLVWWWLGCSTPAPAPDRWQQVVALANLEACAPPPTEVQRLLSDPSLDAEILWRTVEAWHVQSPDARVRFENTAQLSALDDLMALVPRGSGTTVDQLVASLTQCGTIGDATVGLRLAATACEAHGASFVASAEPAGDARSRLARTAVLSMPLARPIWWVPSGHNDTVRLEAFYLHWVLEGDPLTVPALPTEPGDLLGGLYGGMVRGLEGHHAASERLARCLRR